MAEALLPPASTTRKGVDPSKFMGASFAAGSGLQKRVENNEKKITLLKNIIQQRKINVDKLLPASSDGNNKNQTIRTNNLADRLDNIAQSLGVLTRILKQQFNIDKNSASQDLRNKKETEKRDREKGLEGKGGKLVSGVANTITKPFKGFFDSILNYFKNILLGAALLGLVKWLKNPANQGKIESFKKFLTEDLPKAISSVIEHIKKNWKIYAALAATLVALNFIGVAAGLVTVLKALKGIVAFLWSIKGILIGIGLFSAGSLIPKLFPGTVDAQESETAKARETEFGGDKDAQIAALEKQLSELNWFQRNVQGMGSEIEEQIHFLKTGETKKHGFAGGGRPPVGKASIVGEKGPELFVPDAAGIIITNENFQTLISKSVMTKDIERPLKSNNSNKFIDLRNSQQQQQAANSTGSGDRAPSFSSTSGNDLLAVSTLSIGNA